jgi:hypothetical protein
MTGAAVPPARPPAPGHDDGLLDAVALVEAAARDDLEAVMVLGRCADDVSVIAALVQIIGSGWGADDIASGEFRAWALAAAEGGGS